MRAAMRELLLASTELTALIPAARWWRAGNVIDNPLSAGKPFVVMRWIAPVPGDARGRFAHQLRLEVHATRGSYKPCEDWLRAARPLLRAAQDYVGTDGRITQCDYLGHSGDQEDATYKSNFMFDSWQVIGVEL